MAAVLLDSVGLVTADESTILDDLSLEVLDGELMVLIGGSGSGKTSTIRAIAGLELVSSGSIWFDEADVTEVPVSERDVGMVFQDTTAALFPKFSARKNVSFGLRLRKVKEPTVRDRVAAEARALGITNIMERWPSELSAGHKQLVQIARAMVRVPKVLLLDEPMAHVDEPTRVRLRRDLKELQTGYGLTTILATNDADEAMAMADRIAVIDAGRVLQLGAPADLFARPADVNVASLTGPISFLGAKVEPGEQGFWLTGDGFGLRAWTPELARFVDSRVTVGVRPGATRVRSRSEISVVLEGNSYETGSPSSVVSLGAAKLTMPYIDQPVGSKISIAIDSYLVFSDGKFVAAIG